MNSGKINNLKDRLFNVFGIFCTFFGLVVLVVFIGAILKDGIMRIDLDFLMNMSSRNSENAGILTAWTGTLWILVLTTIIAFPLGVGAGIYLEEYIKESKLANFLEVNIANLAGVPSIIYGLLGLSVFIRFMQLGPSLLAGALTLTLLILPIVIVATREAIKAVPRSIYEASVALGASKWQTIKNQILPASMGGIITGVILAISRAVGETAPLIVIGALAYVDGIAKDPMYPFTVLPIQIFNWVSRPQSGFIINAAAAILVLLFITFIMNAIAVYFRNKWQNKVS